MMTKMHHRRGAALIVVLASLIFLAALVLAFLASVNTELKSSKAYSSGANAKLLAQTSVSLAMAQIGDATSGTNAAGQTVAWASQPGMIRTYDDTGSPSGYYKLFSWTDMSGAGGYDATLAANSVPSDWNNQKAIFTDLNQPMRVPDGSTNRLVYPIIDGNNLTDFNGNRTYVTNGAAAVDGFYVAKDAVTTATTNAVPMPVKWLYVLEDGKIVAGSPSGDTQVGIAGASDNNQIVGRVAFWTDDESCKININTASEGTYADMPRANYNNSVENALTKNQPVQGEYQRYPGHPAMTSLSTVLKKPSGMADADWAEELYNIIPRVKVGGSREGTAVTTKATTPIVITPDADRLFSSVDELAFKPGMSGGSRALNNPSVFTKDALQRDRFFLTSFSRAPDVNLFNKPRVSIWPIYENEDPSHLTAFDRLMAFCGKINGSIYYFQRKYPGSATKDLPSGSSKDGLGRNRMLLEYLRSFVGTRIPGFGGVFRDKYRNDTDQVLTEIFDYVRATNLADNSLTDAAKRYTVGLGANKSGLGQVVPIEDGTNNTRGFGRFRTIQGASLLFIANVNGTDADQKDENGASLPASQKVAVGSVRVQAMLILDFFDPSVGSVFNFPDFKWRVSGLNGIKWGAGGTAMSFSGDSVKYTQNLGPIDGAFFGDQMGVSQTAAVAQTGYVSSPIDIPLSDNLLFSGGDINIDILDADSNVLQTVVLNFPGGTFPLPQGGMELVSNKNYDGSSTGKADTHMRYFGGPGRLKSLSDDKPANGGALFVDKSGGDGSGGFDVVRSVAVASGDVRLIAAQKNPPKALFAPINVSKWNDLGAGVMGMHNLRSGSGEPYYGSLIGKLVPNLAYDGFTASGPFSQNSIATRKNGQITLGSTSHVPHNGVALGKSSDYSSGDLYGDWDNASVLLRDGPFINKPDEGSKGDADKAPYDFSRGLSGNTLNSATLFTPNRLIPSAVTFGSLPTGVLANHPWQTLLFRADLTGRHPGNKDRAGDGSVSLGMPADHLLLDFFTMPVVEPYAISEPLSTAGRINMNYQIIPFTYINRETGIRAILKSEKVIAIKDSEVGKYKRSYTPAPIDIRFAVDSDETLKGFQQKFASKDIFRSATEICDLPIVPVGSTYSGMATFWDSYRLTGDNNRERPYATIYPRLTTKSNTYTIYYRVQSLKKVKGGNAGVWDETKDKVVGETRGYQTVERYIDPNNPNIPDYADASVSQPISSFYKFRVLQSKQFAP